MQCGNKAQMASEPRIPELRYAYYRRCQQFRRNGQQCKAPAMKGEPICYKHAEQAATESRRVRQRRELLSRPGAGFGDFKAIQRTISEVVEALLAGRIDAKTAGRLIIELQTASKLLWQQHLSDQRGHEGTQRKQESRREESRREEPRKEELRKEERRLPGKTLLGCGWADAAKDGLHKSVEKAKSKLCRGFTRTNADQKPLYPSACSAFPLTRRKPPGILSPSDRTAKEAQHGSDTDGSRRHG